jgi:phosphatidylserine decarboxylase
MACSKIIRAWPLFSFSARALIFIEADNPEIGLMCVTTIGMAEVSSNIIENKDGNPINPGDHINKGDQLGYFQFGGSTHCLVFRKDVIEKFADEEGEINKGDDIKVRQLIAFTKASSQ